MTTTPTPNDLQELRYRREYWREYVRLSGFLPYMGTSPMTIIQMVYEAQASGKSVTIPIVGRLKNTGVNGNIRLAGREEPLSKNTHTVFVQYRRNAVELSRQDEHFDFSHARESVRPLLKEWSMSKLRDNIIDGLFSVGFSGIQVQTFHSPLDPDRNIQSTSGQNNTWLTVNGDRVLFGNALANTVAGNMASSWGNITTGMPLNTAALSLMKRMAKAKADPHIRPIRLDDGSGREYFMVFTNSLSFRDLKTDPVMQAANRDARAREGGAMNDNPLFQDGDMIWDGMIIREIPEIVTVGTVGAGSTNVGQTILCGAQAIACAYGQEPRFVIKKEDDYEFFTGVGIEEMLGVNKVQRKDGVTGNFIDNGAVTGFFTTLSD